MKDIDSGIYAALQDFIHQISEGSHMAIGDIILYGRHALGDHEQRETWMLR